MLSVRTKPLVALALLLLLVAPAAPHRAHAQAEPLRPHQLQVAIIGAGATGVELAAELHNTTRALVSYGLDRIDPEKDMKLILIEAADRICRRCRRACRRQRPSCSRSST